MKVSFYLKRPNDNRVSVLFAQINYNMTVYKYYLLEKIHPTDWNKKKQCAKPGAKIVESISFNKRLQYISVTMSEVLYKYMNSNGGKSPSPQTYYDLLDEAFDRQTPEKKAQEAERSFWGFFQSFLDRMECGSRVHLTKNTPIAVNTIRNYRNLMNHLRDYQQFSKRDIEFDTIDMPFYYGFVDYLTKNKKVNINTIGKQITQIKVLMREALELGYTTNTIFTHRKFRSGTADTDAVYLNDKEVEELYKLDLSSHKKLERVRDLFVIGCFTGLRFSDLGQLSLISLDDEIIELRQIKTGDPVYIPLQPEVKTIMERYNNGFPSTMSNQKFNEYLKELCIKCESLQKEISLKTFVAGKRETVTKPKWFFVKSHTARRSFATNEYKKGELTIAEIRAITGHKTDKSFYKYIRVTSRENAENVAAKWRERAARKLRIAQPGSQLKAV